MGTPALAADYLFVGPLIVQRLQELLPELPTELCETAEQVLLADKRSTVLMVLWAGDRINDGPQGRAGNGASQLLWQRWLVMLAMNNAGAQPNARNRNAGPLLARLHAALAGWQPQGATRPLRRANAALRPTISQVKAIYPVGFEILLTL